MIALTSAILLSFCCCNVKTQVFDVGSNTWSTAGDLPEEYFTSDLTGFAWQNRYAYFIGGYDYNYSALSTVFSIDGTDPDPLATLTDRASLNVERGDVASAIDDANGFVLIAGGFTDLNNFCEPHTNAELYNVAADVWTEVAPLQYGRADKAVVHLQGEDGIFYAMGGERQVAGFCDLDVEPEPGERTIPINQVERYDQASNTWTTVADLPVHRFRFPAVAEGNEIYTFGGQVAFDQTCDCFATAASIVVYTETDAAVSPFSWYVTGFLAAVSSAWLMGVVPEMM